LAGPVRLVRGAGHDAGARRQGVRQRAGPGHPARRHAHPRRAGPGGGGDDGPLELVAAVAAQPLAAPISTPLVNRRCTNGQLTSAGTTATTTIAILMDSVGGGSPS